MKVAHPIPTHKTEKLVDKALELQRFVDQAAGDGQSLYEAEKGVLAKNRFGQQRTPAWDWKTRTKPRNDWKR